MAAGLTPVEVGGPADLRDLGSAFNDMQERITALIEDQARSMDAVSHDLRTPSAACNCWRVRRVVEARDQVLANVRELNDLLDLLTAYLRAQHKDSEPETVDLAQVPERWPPGSPARRATTARRRWRSALTASRWSRR